MDIDNSVIIWTSEEGERQVHEAMKRDFEKRYGKLEEEDRDETVYPILSLSKLKQTIMAVTYGGTDIPHMSLVDDKSTHQRATHN